MAELRKVEELRKQAREVRKTIITMIHEAQSGHPGGSLSASDLMTALYFDEMNINPKNPEWDERDRFVLSKGHVCPVLYTCLGLKGYFDKEVLLTLRKEGSILQGHPDMKRCPGIDISTGSLGQGLGVAVGMALRGKRDSMDFRVFSLVGDGECQEGMIWESIQTASKYELDNLIIIIDNNGLQNDGTCDDVMPTRDLADKARAFGCDVYRIDGHNMEEILQVFDNIRGVSNGMPKCIVAKTVKGKGVSFMENVPIWHGKAPNDAEFAIAMKDLEQLI